MAKSTKTTKTAKAAKSTKTAKKAPAKKATSKRGETVRVRALKALRNKELTASEVRDAVGIQHNLKPTLEQEVARKHLSYAPFKDERKTTVYKITAAGKKALENGSVDPKRKSAE